MKKGLTNKLQVLSIPEVGFEPTRPKAADFESSSSKNIFIFLDSQTPHIQDIIENFSPLFIFLIFAFWPHNRLILAPFWPQRLKKRN